MDPFVLHIIGGAIAALIAGIILWYVFKPAANNPGTKAPGTKAPSTVPAPTPVAGDPTQQLIDQLNAEVSDNGGTPPDPTQQLIDQLNNDGN